MFRIFAAGSLLTLILASLAHAENWPQWRGAKLDGVSQEKDLPVKWSKTEGIAWRLEMPGAAGATPVIWGDQIFLTSVDGDNLLLMCVGTHGKEIWRQTVSQGNKDVRGDEGNSASPSPCTDGKHVWAMMADGVLACYTVDGKETWKMNLPERYGQFKIQFGMTSTPVLDSGRLYVQLIHGDGDPATREAVIVCLDGATGSEIWKVDRPSDGRKECEHSYASPVIYRDDKQAYLLTHGADYIVAHDLADGHELWRCGDLNPKGNYNNTLRFVASPLAVPGMIVVPSAKQGPVLCLKPDGKGDLTDREDAFYWRRPKDTPDVPSPLIYDGLLYLCRENGNLIVADAKSGKEFYQEATTRDRHRASPVYGDGKVYLCARNGIVTVVKAGEKFEVLSQNNLGEPISASPAISGGRIYIRTFNALYAIGK
ncbi:MAG: PQQ-binding-like beta-propeller repeat protein [Planctomycetales bacterium]|nr:PQQ-binding-like beta-propeller repeat protein [Planctomycetales bacterium]